VVQDRPKVEKAFHDNVPAELTSRVTFQAHNFFNEQPIRADVYFVKQIVHDWPDKHSVEILKSLVPAMKPGSRVILFEGVAPPIEGGAEWEKLPQTAKRLLAAADLQMLALFNAKQRCIEDYVALFKKADSRFELANTVFLPGSAFGLIVMQWKG
jgi:O-methyltransferase